MIKVVKFFSLRYSSKHNHNDPLYTRITHNNHHIDNIDDIRYYSRRSEKDNNYLVIYELYI